MHTHSHAHTHAHMHACTHSLTLFLFASALCAFCSVLEKFALELPFHHLFLLHFVLELSDSLPVCVCVYQ